MSPPLALAAPVVNTAQPRRRRVKLRVRIVTLGNTVLQLEPQARVCVKIVERASTLEPPQPRASHAQLGNTLSTLLQLRNPSLAQLAEQGVSQALHHPRALLVHKESTSRTLRLATSPPLALTVPLASTALQQLQ